MIANNNKALILKSRCGNEFADAVYSHLRTKYEDLFELGEVDIDYFPNREPFVKLRSNVARRRVYPIHSFEGPGEPDTPHTNYNPSVGTMTLYLINDALKRASVDAITDVLPHIPWQRSDRKEEGRVPISSKLFMQLLGESGGKSFERLITTEMHSGQQQGFVEYPVDNLYANHILAEYLASLDKEFVIVAPDPGGGKKARDLAGRLKTDFVYSDKVKNGPEKVRVEIIGDVGNRVPVIVDDMIDTGKTLALTAESLHDKGRDEVYACSTHAILSPKNGITAEYRLKRAGLKIVVTNTIPMSSRYVEAQSDWMTMLSVAPLFAEAIYLRETGGSISGLFGD